ncbi:hypothetical protein SARC_12794 [Sphaeroforma arctica JP610]|uniref:DUF2834 domain-containing protein n=1 Tax=Sphaeroforma arctica JP610 TaxID=667725 RepID=A0A0L0FD41_9EUKA|nr:hypothetical protein SARC_12794 [Sphaeroforma arctica JP610]KNC74667.1 hypothetical protein SARC_12794 [Sphaeroforma arctica JP610]|eukprot:XP_014148569.1 hypothetical protein SARC_12794 [Sphaeroforma arctica JP610]
MTITLPEIYAACALACGAVFLVTSTFSGSFMTGSKAYIVPAIFSSGFLSFSIITIVNEGLAPVWYNHTLNYWGSQICIDLVVGFCVSWYLILPRARDAGILIYPWLVIVLFTGNIGITAMLAFVLFREAQDGRGYRQL